MPCLRLLLFFCLSLSLLSARPATDRIEFYLGIAEGSYLVGDLGGAEKGVEQILRIDPDHLPALKLKARILLDGGQPEAALEAARRAVALAPNTPDTRLLEALILGHMGAKAEAQAIIDRIVAAHPADSDAARAAHQLNGLLLMAQGEWDQAAAAFEQIVGAQETPDPSGLKLRSEAYLEKAREALAERETTAVLSALDEAIGVYSGPDAEGSTEEQSSLRLLKARLLAEIGQHGPAIETLNAHLKDHPEDLKARLTLAALYTQTEQWALLQALIDPLSNRAELADILLYLEGRIALGANRVGTARAKFEAAIEALPPEAEQLRSSLFFYRGLCLAQLERTDEADQTILQALDAGFQPETPAEAKLAIEVLLRAGRPAQALPLQETLTLRHMSADPQAWARLGRLHLQADHPALALSALNRALQLDPRQPDSLALRAVIRRRLGDLIGALVDTTTALGLDPDNGAILYTQGLTELQLGRIPAAEQSLRQASTHLLAPPPGLLLLHALLAYTVEQPDRAASSLRRYFELTPPEAPNQSALYLQAVIDRTPGAPLPDGEPAARYLQGTLDRKGALDAAGIAESPELARRQICAAAFWMAQWERSRQHNQLARELLQIAVEAGQPDLPEYQLARWQLRHRLAEPTQ